MGAVLGTPRCFLCNDTNIKISEKKAKKTTWTPLPPEPPGQHRAKLQIKVGGFSVGAFAASNRGTLEHFYKVEQKVLGEGSYGSVRKCIAKDTNQSCAVKTVSRSQVKNEGQFKEEMAIMRLLDHPNIVRLYETFEDMRNIYLVLELCTGGELFDRILTDGKFTEQVAAHCVQQMFRALNYMHQNWIMHRDLKPENWLLATDEAIKTTDLKLIDFGLSKRFAPGEFASTKAGTPYYVAPEVLDGRYAEKSDVWSIGVIMYILLCGSPPFQGKDTKAVLDSVKLAQPKFDQKEWKGISLDAKAMLKALLTRDPDSRPSAVEAVQSEWIQLMIGGAGVKAASTHTVPAKLRTFALMNKLKKASLNVIATQLDDKAIRDLKALFMSMDSNNDGSLSVGELKDALCKSGVSLPQDLSRMMEQVDCDGSGVIDYSEFVAATMERRKYISEDVCWRAFKTFDVDGSGSIDRQELGRLLGIDDVCDVMQVEVTQKEIDAIMDEVDTNQDGKIDFGEFLEMMRRMPRPDGGKRKNSVHKRQRWPSRG